MTEWNHPPKLDLGYSVSIDHHTLDLEKVGTLSEVPACGVMRMRALGGASR
jgi:hypothetical protein